MARTGWVLVTCGVLSAVVSVQTRGSGGAVRSASRVYLADARAHAAVSQAILGAQRRLARPACQQVLAEFRDDAGHQLLEALEATGQDSTDYLVERVWFVDGSDSAQCTKDAATAAFTATGHKVIHVCSARFAKLGHTKAAEMLIIHELLHTLGLGENPPSSAEITQRVTARCGAG
jgi:hypothetical protein